MEDLLPRGEGPLPGRLELRRKLSGRIGGAGKGGQSPFSRREQPGAVQPALAGDRVRHRAAVRGVGEISILCYSPLHQALLSGKFLTADDVPEKRRGAGFFRRAVDDPARRAGLRGGGVCRAQPRSRQVAEEIGQPMGRLAIAWLSAQAGVTAAIAGAAARRRPPKTPRPPSWSWTGGSGVVVGDHGAAQATGGAERRPVGARLANGAAGGSVSWIVLIGCTGPVGYMNYVCRSQ